MEKTQEETRHSQHHHLDESEQESFMCHKRELTEQFYSLIGRSHRSMNPQSRLPGIPAEILPPDDVIIPYDDVILEEVKRRCHLPLVLKSIDCHVIENATRHLTTQYEQTKDTRPAHRISSALQKPSGSEPDAPVSEVSSHRDSIQAQQGADSHDPPPRRSAPQVYAHLASAFQASAAQLVLRRGQKFTVELAFDRPYDRERDDIVFTFQFGDEVAGVSSGSVKRCRVSDGIKPNHWSAGVTSSCNDLVLVQLLTPPTTLIGRATLSIDTVRRETASDTASSVLSMSIADEYDVITGGYDVKELEDVDKPKPGEDVEEEEEEEEEDEIDVFDVDEPVQRRHGAERDRVEAAAARRQQLKAWISSLRHKRVVVRYVHAQSVYLLFNPWNHMDHVFMGDHELCKQYVLSDVGDIFYGNERQISARPWNYGQFEHGVLDTVVSLLDLAGLRSASRNSAVNVVRTICKLVTSGEDHGLMSSSWSGRYRDGTPPPLWTGTVPILREFVQSDGQPVKYGQCWVHAAVAATLCRSLGIPCRCVTSFSSAHDCDGSSAVNMHWNYHGEPLDQWNSDALWCFHVWNEAFMSRPDLDSAQRRSWQAFDVTPQITAHGVYSAGPCSVSSIRRGDIFSRYDCAQLFYDVNSDVVHWTLELNGRWRTTTEKYRTGRLLLTDGAQSQTAQQVGVQSSHSSQHSLDAVFPIVDIHADCIDITAEYKCPRGSEEERAALHRANQFFSLTRIYDSGDGDVKYEIEERGPVPVGSEFTVLVRAQNYCRDERTVNLTLTIVAVHYTGLTWTKIRSEIFNFNLCSLRYRLVEMRVSVEDYSPFLSELSMFRVYLHANVDETQQLTATFADFRLILPQLDIVGPRSALLGSSFEFTVQLSSPMLISLTRCHWMIEALGLLNAIKIPQPDMEPYERARATVSVRAMRSGTLTIVACFHSKELSGVSGTMEVNVIAPEHFSVAGQQSV